MTLHLVQILPDDAKLARFAHTAGLPEADPGYLWHFALRQRFAEAAPQPFRVFDPDPDDRKPLRLLGYTATDEATLREAAARADTELADIFPADRIQAKRLPDSIAHGRCFAFSTRVCPIVRTLSSDGTRKRELDVYIHAASATPDAPKPDRADIYRDWLSRKLGEGGATLHAAKLTGFRLGGLVRRIHASPNGRTKSAESAPKRLLATGKRAAARRPDATLDGILEITDSNRFMALLGTGIGRHRAFGFGMLLLRPAG